MIAQGDVFLSKALESAIVLHQLLNCGSLLGGDTFAELLALEKPLQHKVRAKLLGLARWGFKELLAQGTSAHVVDGLHVEKDAVPLLAKRVELGLHGGHCICTDTILQE